MKSNQNKFRIAAKVLFLTYPSNNILTLELVKNELVQKLEDKQLQWIICSKEESDGEYEHIHVALETRIRVDTTSQRFFDIEGIHGNYQTCKNKKKAIAYICKEGNYVADGIDPSGTLYKGLKKPFERFIFRCQVLKHDPQSIIDECRNNDRYDRDLIEIYADYLSRPMKYKKAMLELKPLKPIINNYLLIHKEVVKSLIAWCNDRHLNGVFKKVLFIKGESGTGKTTLALQLSENESLLLRHKDAMKGFIASKHKTIVFDDMNFSKKNREYGINLTDTEVPLQFDVKGSMVHIDKTVQRIFTSNNSPEDIFKGYDEAIDRRIHKLDIDEIFLQTDMSPIYFEEENIPKKYRHLYDSMKDKTITKMLNYLIEVNEENSNHE